MMPDIDLGPITSHQARITAYCLQMAIDSGELSLKQNYDAALQVKAMLALRLAQMHEPKRDAYDDLEMPTDFSDETLEDRRMIFAREARRDWMARR